MWILSCVASVGHLSRMTQWKVDFPIPRAILDSQLAEQASTLGNSLRPKLTECESKIEAGPLFLSRSPGCGHSTLRVRVRLPADYCSARSLTQDYTCASRRGPGTASRIRS